MHNAGGFILIALNRGDSRYIGTSFLEIVSEFICFKACIVGTCHSTGNIAAVDSVFLQGTDQHVNVFVFQNLEYIDHDGVILVSISKSVKQNLLDSPSQICITVDIAVDIE